MILIDKKYLEPAQFQRLIDENDIPATKAYIGQYMGLVNYNSKDEVLNSLPNDFEVLSENETDDYLDSRDQF